MCPCGSSSVVFEAGHVHLCWECLKNRWPDAPLLSITPPEPQAPMLGEPATSIDQSAPGEASTWVPEQRVIERPSPLPGFVLTARVGTNGDLLADAFNLFVPTGVTIADVTYGRGSFWSELDQTQYQVLNSIRVFSNEKPLCIR